jgi:hypothetical protein
MFAEPEKARINDNAVSSTETTSWAEVKSLGEAAWMSLAGGCGTIPYALLNSGHPSLLTIPCLFLEKSEIGRKIAKSLMPQIECHDVSFHYAKDRIIHFRAKIKNDERAQRRTE